VFYLHSILLHVVQLRLKNYNKQWLITYQSVRWPDIWQDTQQVISNLLINSTGFDTASYWIISSGSLPACKTMTVWKWTLLLQPCTFLHTVLCVLRCYNGYRLGYMSQVTGVTCLSRQISDICLQRTNVRHLSLSVPHAGVYPAC